MAINVGTLTAIFKAVDQFTGTANKIAGSAEGMVGKFQKAGDRITGIGVSAVKALAGIGIAGGIAAVGFIGAATKMASGFQDQMAILSVAAKGSGLSMETLRQAALAVGGDVTLVGVSATGAADSMTGLMKAGLSTTEIFGDLQGFLAGTSELSGALRASIDLAAASELDMVQASDLAAVALSTFGGELETEAERAEFVNFALNNMVKAADASVAEVGHLAEALKFAGPTAAALGIGIGDTNNALAILSTRGKKGSIAGTGLNRMLLNLTNTTDKSAAAMEAMGIKVFNQQGEFRPLVDIIGQFSDATATMTDEQRQAALGTIFTTQGLATMTTLLQEGTEGWEAMAEATDNAAGIQEQAAARTNTFSGTMEALGGVFETLMIRIGDQFLPIADAFAKWVTGIVTGSGPRLIAIIEKVVGAFSKLIEQIRGFGLGALFTQFEDGSSIIQAFFENLGVGEGVAGDIANAFFGIVNAFKKVVEIIVDNKAAIIGAIKAIAGAIAALVVITRVTKVASALASLTNPLTLIIVLIGLLGAAWSTNWGGIQEKTAAVLDFLQPMFEDLVAFLSEIIPRALETLSSFWAETLKPALEEFGQFITDVIFPIFERVMVWLSENIPLAIQVLADFWQGTLQPAIAQVASIILDVLIPAFATLVGWLMENIPVAMEAATAVWNEVLKPIFDAIGSLLFDTVIPALAEFAGWLQEKIPVAMQAAGEFWETTLKPVFEDIWNFITATLVPAIAELITAFEENLPNAMTFIEEVWNDVLKPVLEAMWGFIQDTLIPIITVLVNQFLNDLSNAFTIVQDVWMNILKPALEALWSFTKNLLVPAIVELVGIVGTGLQASFIIAQTAWNSVLKPILEALFQAFDKILGIIGDAIGAVADFIGTLAGIPSEIGGIQLPLIGGSPEELGIGGLRGAPSLEELIPGMQSGGFLARLHGPEIILPLGDPRSVNALANALKRAFASPQFMVPALADVGGGGTMRRGGDIFNQGGDTTVNVTDPLGAEIILEEINAKQFETIERTM